MSRPKASILTLTVLVLVAASTPATAQFAEDALRFSHIGSAVGPRALALGGTSVSRAEDLSTLFSNPAGLSMIKDYELAVGFSRNGVANDATYLGNLTNGNNTGFAVEHAGLVYPVPTTRGGLTFAFAFGRTTEFTSASSFSAFNPTSSIVRALAPTTDLWAMSVADEQALLDSNIPFQVYVADTSNGYLFPVLTDSLQQSGSVLEGGGMNSWSFGGGIDVAKNLSLGVSLNFVSGTYTYDREFIESDSRNVYQSSYAFPYNFDRFTFTSTIQSEISGFNMVLGLLARQPGRYKLGLTIRTPMTLEISEVFTDEGRSRFDDGWTASKSITNRTDYKVQTPAVLSAGMTVQPTDWLAVSADAEYTDWTTAKFDTENLDLLDENRYIKKAFRETVNLRAGAEVTLWELGLILRGGLAWLPSPYKDDPSTYDQRYVTGGLGIKLDNSTVLNFAGALGQWKSFRDNYTYPDLNNILQTVTVRESLQDVRLSVGLSYRF